MPTASASLRARWDDETAVKHLTGRGYVLIRGWCWEKPAWLTAPSDDDWSAVDYLIQEWDYGGIL